MSPEDEAYASRESAWQWPLHAFLLFMATFFVLLAFAWEGIDRFYAIVLVLVTAGPSITDLLTRRRVVIDARGITIGGVLVPWSAIEKHTFREVPPVKSGLLLRLTEGARKELGIRRPGRYAGPRGEPYDLYLRAHGDAIEEWFTRVSLHMLKASGERLQDNMEVLKKIIREQPQAAAVQLVTEAPYTLSLHVASLDELDTSASAIAKAVPDAVRWDPTFDGAVMILIGPLTLGDEPHADAAVARLKATVEEAFAGSPDVEAMFAERR